jgi:UDP-glucose:(heptosyl)LPS alpha-1,3-glucosyltransferase
VKLAIIRKRYSSAGGGEKFIERFGEQLIKTGVSVSVLAKSWVGNTLEWIPIESSGLTRLAKYKSFSKGVSIALQRENFDIVQTHERLLGADIFRVGDGLHASWLMRYRKLLSPLRRAMLNNDPFHKYILEIERRLTLETDTVFAVNSELIADELSYVYKVPSTRIRVIPNGVDTNFFTMPSFDVKERSKLSFGFLGDDRVISFVGSGFLRKGLGELISALMLLPSDIKVLVAGYDKFAFLYRRQTERLGLASRVKFLGSLLDMRAVYWASDIFVLPTLYDPNSNAALEALSCGLPVVSTASMGGMTEILEKKAGCLVERDPQTIAEAIQRTLYQVDTCDIRLCARKLAESLDDSLIIPKWLNLYEKILNDKGLKLAR